MHEENWFYVKVFIYSCSFEFFSRVFFSQIGKLDPKRKAHTTKQSVPVRTNSHVVAILVSNCNFAAIDGTVLMSEYMHVDALLVLAVVLCHR